MLRLTFGHAHLLRIYLVYSSPRSDKQTRILIPSSNTVLSLECNVHRRTRDVIYVGNTPETSLYSPLLPRGRALRSPRLYSSGWRRGIHS